MGNKWSHSCPAVKRPMDTTPGLVPDVRVVTPKLIVLSAFCYALLCRRQLCYKDGFDALQLKRCVSCIDSGVGPDRPLVYALETGQGRAGLGIELDV